MKVTANVKLEHGLTAICSANIYTENYGADADGNRGQLIKMFDEVEAILGDHEIYEILAPTYKQMIDEALMEAYDYEQDADQSDFI